MAESISSTPQPRTTRPSDSFMPAERLVNVGDLERWLSLCGAGLLALYLLRRHLGTVVLLGGAGALLYRGLTGHSVLYQAMAISTASPDSHSDNPHSVTEPDEKPLIVLAGS